jgi:hypothetical protein
MQGGVRFEGFNGHSMTNWYSSYVKQHFYNDTGMTEVLGDWVCWKSDTPQPPSNAQVLYEIVQASVSQPDPYTYVRARLRDQDVPAPPDDFEDEDEENDDYPESVVGAVDEGLAKTIYQNLMWMAEHNGALSNGLHLRTLMHLVEHNVALAKKNETTWLAGRDALGMGQYSLDEAKRMSNDDLQLIGMSFATGLDYREPYRMFGIAISAKAAAQVESLGLYPLPREVMGPNHPPPVRPHQIALAADRRSAPARSAPCSAGRGTWRCSRGPGSAPARGSRASAAGGAGGIDLDLDAVDEAGELDGEVHLAAVAGVLGDDLGVEAGEEGVEHAGVVALGLGQVLMDEVAPGTPANRRLMAAIRPGRSPWLKAS